MAKNKGGNSAAASTPQGDSTQQSTVSNSEPSEGGASAIPVLDAAAEARAVLDNAPEVSEHVVSQQQPNSGGGGLSAMSSPVSNAAGPADQSGRVSGADPSGWDPSIHATGKDGRGVRNADGSWKKKRQPRQSTAPKSGVSGSAVRSNGGQPVLGMGVSAPFNPDRARASGVIAGRATLQMLAMFGSEWKADKDETSVIESSMGDYFVATQRQDFPPGIMLCMVFGTFVARRFTMPKTQSLMKRALLRVAAWRIRRQLKKKGIVADVVVQDGEIHIIGKDAKAGGGEVPMPG